MKEKLAALKIEYRTNPGWCWLLAILFLFPLLPEYVSPFILFAGFIVFKVQWSREGRKAKVGTIGKMMMLFMGYALLSTLWSPTSFSTFSTAALWWGMFLLQVMIYNLARSRDKIDALLQTCTASACVNGVIGTLQICGYTLNRYDCIPDGAVLVTPLYKGLDKFVYTHLPFAISTKTFDSRASGTFSNPNLLATHMVIAYPISIYLFLNAKTKKQKVLCFLANVLISAGLSSTLTRAGCVIALAGWVFMFIVLCRRYWKQMLTIFLPTIRAMQAEGRPFKGCLYFGLMLTPDGPKVIEYNCRFGDPETQVVLPLLEGDLLHIMQACTNGTLENEEVKFSDGAAACVILASGGYPVAYEKGKPITGLVDGQLPGEENVTVYHSGTAITEDGTLVTAGGRVLGVTATGPRLTNALSHAYEAAEKISFEKLHKRSDIGLRALKALAEKQ